MTIMIRYWKQVDIHLLRIVLINTFDTKEFLFDLFKEEKFERYGDDKTLVEHIYFT